MTISIALRLPCLHNFFYVKNNCKKKIKVRKNRKHVDKGTRNEQFVVHTKTIMHSFCKFINLMTGIVQRNEDIVKKTKYSHKGNYGIISN